jgi:peptidoglycan/xylan/chitin deacetylase (PgdA/CDA1 family)
VRRVVLCYHAVSDSWNHRLSLPPAQLLAQIRLLRRFADVHVTFDDAFRSVRVVLPSLGDLGLPVTIFVCSGFADRDGAPLLVRELETQAAEDLQGLQTMSWEKLRELVAAGVAVGSHTVSHPHLPSLSDADLADELSESKVRIEDELGRPCPLLAYPYGEHDLRVRRGARAAGYEGAYSLRARRGDPFAMPRLDLYRRHTPVRSLLAAGSSLLSSAWTNLPKEGVRTP